MNNTEKYLHVNSNTNAPKDTFTQHKDKAKCILENWHKFSCKNKI